MGKEHWGDCAHGPEKRYWGGREYTHGSPSHLQGHRGQTREGRSRPGVFESGDGSDVIGLDNVMGGMPKSSSSSLPMPGNARKQVTYCSSVINAGFPVTPSNVPKLMSGTRSVGWHRHGLRYEMWKGSLAVLDGNGGDLPTQWPLLALLCEVGGRAPCDTSWGRHVLSNKEIVQVHRVRGRVVVQFGRFSQLGNAAWGISSGTVRNKIAS